MLIFLILQEKYAHVLSFFLFITFSGHNKKIIQNKANRDDALLAKMDFWKLLYGTTYDARGCCWIS